MLVTQQQAAELHQGSGNPPRQNAAGNQCTHGKQTVSDHINPHDHHTNQYQLTDKLEQGGYRRGIKTVAGHRQAAVGSAVFPARLHIALCAEDFYILNCFECLNQNTVAYCRFAHVLFHQPCLWPLRQQTDGDHGDQGYQRNQCDVAGNQVDHPDKEQGERQVRKCSQSGRGKEVPQAFQFADLICLYPSRG